MAEAAVLEKRPARVSEQGLLFDYTIKLLLVAGFLELVLYRLASRLGMHLSKVAEEHEWVRVAFTALSQTGFLLLNVVSLLLFLGLFLFLFHKMRSRGSWRGDALLVPSASLLMLLTVAYLLYPPAMLGAIVYNVIFFVVLGSLVLEYLSTHQTWGQRSMILCYSLGVTGWLYYQTVSTGFAMFGWGAAPPLVHEANRLGEAMMVLASVLVFWAYGGVLWTKNRRQRRRVLQFGFVSGVVFATLLFLDYFAALYDEALAADIRQAGQGIGWIFQMGMGYTFYLPFACYVLGLLCWAYTVLKLITVGRMAGFGLGLMFFAGYALQLSHLSLMVVLGLILLNLDKRRAATTVVGEEAERYLSRPAAPVLTEQTS